MSFNSSWVPNEDHLTLVSERSWLQGVIISAVAYGIIVSLYLLTLSHLLREKNRVEFKKRIPLLIYITIAFLLSTFITCTCAAVAQMSFVDDRNYPGGPNAYEDNQFSIPVDFAQNVAFVLSNWLSDALLVWRFKVIYQWCRVPIQVMMLVPCFMLAGSVVLGVLLLIRVSTSERYSSDLIYFLSPYSGLSLALNIVLTTAMVFRLLSFRYRIVSIMGSTYGKHYVSITAMIVESAALYSAVSIAFLVLLGIKSVISEVFLQSLSQFQTIATLLIIFRVAQGKSWDKDTPAHVVTALRAAGPSDSVLRFGSPDAPLELASASSGRAARNSDVEP